MFSLSKFEEGFVAFWCVVMPITGLVVLPSVQGTIPAYLCAFGSFLLVLLRMRSGELDRQTVLYFRSGLIIFLIWLLLLVGSQISLIISHRHDFGGIELIQPELEPVVFRPTLFTQSLYFAACLLTAFYFRYFFEERWMRYVHWGAYFLAGYGIYEWTYYLLFNQVGDFLNNRMFGDHPGSWSQSLDFGGVHLLRIKSTLGEPTFFAAVVIPYFYLALDARKRLLAAMLLFTAIFSISTACYICLGITLLVTSLWSGRPRVGRVGLIFVVAAFLVAIAVFFPDMFRGMFEDKIAGNNNSGADRLAGAQAMNDLFASFSVGNWIFGIGFGYVYSAIYYGLLMNTGLIGLGVFLWVFGRALWQLPVRPGFEGHKAGILAIMILSGISLSELFLPPTWMFIGLAYYALDRARLSRGEAAGVPVASFVRRPAMSTAAPIRRLPS